MPTSHRRKARHFIPSIRTRAHLKRFGLPAALISTLIACGDDAPPAEPTPTPAATQTPTPMPTATPTPEPSHPTPPPTPTPKPDIPLPLTINSSTPGNGAMAVPRTTSYTIVFNENLTGDYHSIQVTLSGPGIEGGSVELSDPTLSDDLKSLTYAGPILSEDSDYTLDVVYPEDPSQDPQPEAWPIEHHSTFSTTFPCGVGFNITAQNVQIVKLGSNEQLVDTLNNILSSAALDPVDLLFVDVLTGAEFPVDPFKIVSALVYPAGGGTYELDDDYGFSVGMEGCSLSTDGLFECGPDSFVFPIPLTDDTALNLYLSDATLSATVIDSGNINDMNEFDLKGIITENDIERILEEANLSGLSDAITLDLDTNGDGINDAATAEATSNPAWIELDYCNPVTGEIDL